MTNDKKIARICARASDIRQIAEGVFDRKERETLLNFVADAEGLAQNVAKSSASEPGC